MEKELKIAELANIWGVSVPTTWNRVNKENLTTFMKKDENNKNVNYVRISEEKINEYIVNVKNNNNNDNYEVILNNNNVKNNNLISQTTDISGFLWDMAKEVRTEILNINNDYNERIANINNAHNEQIKNVYEELIKYKSQVPLLEDRANREGLYLKEINEAKKHNKILIITLIIVSILFAISCVALAFYYNKPPQVIETEKVVTVEKPVYVKGKR